MAKVLDPTSNKIQLDNGSIVSANTGGWYDGQQYWGGSLSARGVINSQSNQQGAGQAVSAAVNAQSASSQGSSVQDFNQYLSNISVRDIQPATSVPYTTNANGSYITSLNGQVNAARNTLDQNIADQRTTTQTDLAAAKARESSALSSVNDLTQPFRANLETTQRQQLGVDQTLADQRSLLSELDNLLTEGNYLIKQQKEVTGLASIRNPRVQKTMDDISARAGVINAVVSLQNTYLANAYTSIDRSVNAITQDRQDQLNYYSTVLSLANRDIVSLTTEDRKLAEQQTSILADDLKRAQTTSDYIKQLMINPDTALSMAQSGVTLNDTVETINNKLANYEYSKEVKDAANQFTSAGGVLVTNPSSVPAAQLKSFTDSKGVTYYYKMPKTGTGANTTTADDYLKKTLKGSEVDNSVKTDQTKTEEAPNYSPAGGTGSVYVDPTTGTIWQYTSSGWKKIS